MYQKQYFVKENTGDEHVIPGWQVPMLLGEDCGAGFTSDTPGDAVLCDPGSTTFNYTFIYPTASYGGDPDLEGAAGTMEGDRVYGWFEVDPEMYAIAEEIAESTVLANEGGDVTLDYQPVVTVGGNGVAGPTFVDNAEFRDHVFETFQAVAVDMESPALASVCTQFGVPFIIFLTTMTTFLEALPVMNAAEEPPMPADFEPGEDTPGLLGLLSFYKPELDAMLAIMKDTESLFYGGRRFYRGKIHGADVVACLTGVSIENAAISTALMLQLYPGVERLIGGGIAGGVDPSLDIGDVVVPDQWAMYQMQIYGKDIGDGIYEPVAFEQDLIVGKNCGGWDGVGRFLLGEGPCDWEAGEASNFGMIYPKTIQTPDPNAEDPLNQISEGFTRKVCVSTKRTISSRAHIRLTL
ncbi:MAG: hypothetical protein SGARI_000140 [Bacillariaceae sp.]